MSKLERYKVALHSESLFKEAASFFMPHAMCVCVRARVENASEGMGGRKSFFA